MKIRNFFAAAITLLSLGMFVACNSDEEYDQTFTRSNHFMKPNETEKQLKNIYDSKIIHFSKNHYYLLCDSEKAAKMGINDSIYDSLQEEIVKTNEMIEEIITNLSSQGYDNIKITDCTYDDSETDLKNLERLVPPDEPQMPHGVLTAPNNSPVCTSIYAPYNQVGVKANCYANASLFAFHAIITTYAGSNAFVASKMGNGELKVKIAMANTTIGFQYQTTDSNGGICSWKGVKSLK